MNLAYEEQYLSALKEVRDKGKWVYNERTQTECLTLPKYLFEIDLKESTAPLLSTRPSYPVGAIAEILGYLRRYEWSTQFSNIGSKLWDKNANETEAWLRNPHRKGDFHLGKIYGGCLEPEYIYSILDKLHKGADDRGLKLDWWQPEKFDKGCLRPCLSDHQFTILGNEVSLVSNQRSQDFLCGGNYNALQVYFMGMLGAKLSGKEGTSAWLVVNNLHVYKNHLDGMEELLSRKPTKLDTTFKINDWVQTPNDILGNDIHAREYFTLEGYKGVPQSKIDFEMVA